jgi:hypothetical protein
VNAPFGRSERRRGRDEVHADPVESPERAVEIAAQASAASGPGGVPIEQPIEVREIMGAPQSD